MPCLQSTFSPPWYLRPGHVQSIVPTLCRRVSLPTYRRERLELLDGDFLDLDWLEGGNGRLAIISHGLEGSSRSGYARGLALTLAAQGWDVLAWNMRGCGGTNNRLLSWYHSGKSEDLRTVINHAYTVRTVPTALIGISVGGNITLKYLGEEGRLLPGHLKAAVTLSVPVDLESSARQLAKWQNRGYMEYLLRPLRRRLLEKALNFPGQIDVRSLHKIRTFEEFDRKYTAPIHGFHSVLDYWSTSSSAPLLRHISLPTLIINAKNDPFLGPDCFPVRAAEENGSLFLELPRSGGHVGFIASHRLRNTWAEGRIAGFLSGLD